MGLSFIQASGSQAFTPLVNFFISHVGPLMHAERDIVMADLSVRPSVRLPHAGIVSRLSSGPNAEHRQLQIDIKDSPVRGATRHALQICCCYYYYYYYCI